MPLYHSSPKCFWPILGRVYTSNNLYKPFPVAVYCGSQKPRCLELYLNQFIEEINYLLENGLSIGGKKFTIQIMCFICDTPARAFVKGTQGHTGFYACERSTTVGYRCGNKTVFPMNKGIQRTAESSRQQTNAQHHRISSPLLRIKPAINLVMLFVLDFMHLGCLGVMKKLLNDHWMKPGETKLTRENRLRISRQILLEFQRTTRSLGDLAKWKATEFRFFLLYSGMFVLKEVLPQDLYEHFPLFSVACRILSCKRLRKLYADHAQIYLERFVCLSTDFYGELL